MKPAEVIKNQVKELDCSYGKVRKHFREKEVHDFRLRIKRLRAFISLLNYDRHHRLKFPKKLKALYDCAGAVRNLQLQQKRVLHASGNAKEIATGSYLKLLTAEEAQWRTKTLQINGHVKRLRKILHVPESVQKGTARKFLQAEAAKLWNLLLAHEITDKDLHHLRKFLKGILYNWQYAGEQAGLYLPLCWRYKKDIRAFTEVLGQFHDLGMALQFLEAKIVEITALDELQLLQQIECEWRRERDGLRQTILTTLETINIGAS